MKLFKDGDIKPEVLTAFTLMAIGGLILLYLILNTEQTNFSSTSTSKRAFTQPLTPVAKPLIDFIETDKNLNIIPNWIKRLNPKNIDTKLMIISYENSIDFSHDMNWNNWKPTIGEIQYICGNNKECWLDFGYIK